jgi:transketolase
MPSWDLFEKQSSEYQEQVLPPTIRARVSVEQASVFGWDRYVGSTGISIGMRTFGTSAPLADLLTYFGFTVENVVNAAKKSIEKSR